MRPVRVPCGPAGGSPGEWPFFSRSKISSPKQAVGILELPRLRAKAHGLSQGWAHWCQAVTNSLGTIGFDRRNNCCQSPPKIRHRAEWTPPPRKKFMAG
jgi:hypothetical protein